MGDTIIIPLTVGPGSLLPGGQLQPAGASARPQALLPLCVGLSVRRSLWGVACAFNTKGSSSESQGRLRLLCPCGASGSLTVTRGLPQPRQVLCSPPRLGRHEVAAQKEQEPRGVVAPGPPLPPPSVRTFDVPQRLWFSKKRNVFV